MTVFLQVGLFLLHLLEGTETHCAGTTLGFRVTIMFSFCGLKVSLRYEYTGVSTTRHTARLFVFILLCDINPYPTAFPYGNGMVLHFYQQQESSTTKTVHKVINKGLKTYV